MTWTQFKFASARKESLANPSPSWWRHPEQDPEIWKLLVSRDQESRVISNMIMWTFGAVNNGQVPTSAQAQGNHTYAISFVPKESKPHIVELKFNGENVPGSPFKCAIADAAKVR